MKKFHFTEAKPLMTFLEMHKEKIIGHPLHKLDIEYWPGQNRSVLTDRPLVLQLDEYCLAIRYFITSDMEILVGTKEELEEDDDAAFTIHTRNEVNDYYDEEFGDGEKREWIENCKITEITVDRFSEAFEYNTNGDVRPAGGEYFSAIRFRLDSGKTLCFCGVDSITDGYVQVWCE